MLLIGFAAIAGNPRGNALFGFVSKTYQRPNWQLSAVDLWAQASAAWNGIFGCGDRRQKARI